MRSASDVEKRSPKNWARIGSAAAIPASFRATGRIARSTAISPPPHPGDCRGVNQRIKMAIVSQRIRHREGEESLARTELAAIPFRSSEMAVEDDWIDYNGHLNMAYYNVLFDRAIDQFLEALGIGPTYVKARNATMFALEA